MKKVLSVILLAILVLGITTMFLSSPVSAEPDDEDPGAYVKVQLSPGTAGISVTIDVLSLSWGGSVKVEDGSWLGGWGSSAVTTTDGSGLAQFRVWRLALTIDIRITVDAAPPEDIYGMSLGLIWCAPTHTLNWYKVTFDHTGLDSSATGTVVTVNSATKTYSNLPYAMWVYSGNTVAYNYESDVSSTIIGKQFVLTSVTGPTSPITVTSPVTVIGNYKTQYSVTFTVTGMDATATGTVATINSVSKVYSDLFPAYSFWADSGDTVTYCYNSIVSSSVSGKRFRLDSVTGPASPFVVTAPVTVMGNYKTQYYLTVFARPSGLVPTPAPSSGWFDECTSMWLEAPASAEKDGVVYYFDHWRADGKIGAVGMTRIWIHMDSPKTACAWYCDVPGIVDPVGDVNYDGKIDISDIAMIARYYGGYVGGPNYKLGCDVNVDGKIDLRDLAAAARNLNE